MGKLETESRKRTKKNELQRLILTTVKTAGIVSLALVAPGVLVAMSRLGLKPSLQQKAVIERSSQRLVRQGLLAWEGKKLRLTKKGEEKMLELSLREQVKQKRRWDGKWRVLVFDIPERRKRIRQWIRNTVREIGFIRLQDSVWVYPYDCEDLITLIKANLHIGDAMLYMIADTIERDFKLKQHFKLP